jgi:Tol biopolymer transport system component
MHRVLDRLKRFAAVAIIMLAWPSLSHAQLTRVSVATDGTQASSGSTDMGGVAISANGRFIAFSSASTNLVANDLNGLTDVFVRDVVGNTTTLVSVAPGGGQFVGDSYVGAISDDGTVVAFYMRPSTGNIQTMTCHDDYGAGTVCDAIYVHDRTSGTTTLVSVASDGTPGNDASRNPHMSGDGRLVVFESRATNLVPGDTNGVRDIFLHDRVTHQTTRVSVGQDGAQSANPSYSPFLSRNGKTLGFVASGPAFGDGPLVNPTCASLDCERPIVRSLESGAVRRLTPVARYPDTEPTSAGNLGPVVLSADGRYAAFSSFALFFGNTQPFVELQDLATGLALTPPRAQLGGRISYGRYNLLALSDDGRYLAISGAGSTPPESLRLTIVDRVSGLAEYAPGTNPNSGLPSPSFDASGRWLVFTSSDPTLVPGDTNGASDVFLLDRDPDADGMPTAWEQQFGLDPANPADANADPDGDGLTNLQEFQASSHPKGAHARYFAEGASNGFFSTRVAVANPNPAPATVLLHLLGSNGQQTSRSRTIPANQRATFDLGLTSGLPDTAFSTIVESDLPVVADRMMTWDVSHGSYGSHLETSIDAPSTTWYLAEGATGGFSLYYLLQNPGAAPASVTVDYLRPGSLPVLTKTYTVEAHSRFTIDVAGEDAGLRATEVSAKITSTTPIVVERAMYRSAPGQLFAAGHDGAGVAAPATRWFLAEGATGFFDEFILIANAESNRADITVTYLLEGGESFTESFPVPAQTRYTLDLKRNARLKATPVSAIVESTNSVPIVVERVMWWPAGGVWYEASLSAGVTTTGTKWVVAEGEQGGALHSQTYVLIANTHASTDGEMTVTLLFEDATTAQVKVVVPHNSRKTIDMGSIPEAANKRFSVVVESDGAPIVVERSFYSSPNGVLWEAGATSVATNVTPTP